MSSTPSSKIIDSTLYPEADAPKDSLSGTYLEEFKGGEGGEGGGAPLTPLQEETQQDKDAMQVAGEQEEQHAGGLGGAPPPLVAQHVVPRLFGFKPEPIFCMMSVVDSPAPPIHYLEHNYHEIDVARAAHDYVCRAGSAVPPSSLSSVDEITRALELFESGDKTPILSVSIYDLGAHIAALERPSARIYLPSHASTASFNQDQDGINLRQELGTLLPWSFALLNTFEIDASTAPRLNLDAYEGKHVETIWRAVTFAPEPTDPEDLGIVAAKMINRVCAWPAMQLFETARAWAALKYDTHYGLTTEIQYEHDEGWTRKQHEDVIDAATKRGVNPDFYNRLAYVRRTEGPHADVFPLFKFRAHTRLMLYPDEFYDLPGADPALQKIRAEDAAIDDQFALFRYFRRHRFVSRSFLTHKLAQSTAIPLVEEEEGVTFFRSEEDAPATTALNNEAGNIYAAVGCRLFFFAASYLIIITDLVLDAYQRGIIDPPAWARQRFEKFLLLTTDTPSQTAAVEVVAEFLFSGTPLAYGTCTHRVLFDIKHRFPGARADAVVARLTALESLFLAYVTHYVPHNTLTRNALKYPEFTSAARRSVLGEDPRGILADNTVLSTQLAIKRVTDAALRLAQLVDPAILSTDGVQLFSDTDMTPANYKTRTAEIVAALSNAVTSKDLNKMLPPIEVCANPEAAVIIEAYALIIGAVLGMTMKREPASATGKRAAEEQDEQPRKKGKKSKDTTDVNIAKTKGYLDYEAAAPIIFILKDGQPNEIDFSSRELPELGGANAYALILPLPSAILERPQSLQSASVASNLLPTLTSPNLPAKDKPRPAEQYIITDDGDVSEQNSKPGIVAFRSSQYVRGMCHYLLSGGQVDLGWCASHPINESIVLALSADFQPRLNLSKLFYSSRNKWFKLEFEKKTIEYRRGLEDVVKRTFVDGLNDKATPLSELQIEMFLRLAFPEIVNIALSSGAPQRSRKRVASGGFGEGAGAPPHAIRTQRGVEAFMYFFGVAPGAMQTMFDPEQVRRLLFSGETATHALTIRTPAPTLYDYYAFLIASGAQGMTESTHPNYAALHNPEEWSKAMRVAFDAFEKQMTSNIRQRNTKVTFLAGDGVERTWSYVDFQRAIFGEVYTTEHISRCSDGVLRRYAPHRTYIGKSPRRNIDAIDAHLLYYPQAKTEIALALALNSAEGAVRPNEAIKTFSFSQRLVGTVEWPVLDMPRLALSMQNRVPAVQTRLFVESTPQKTSWPISGAVPEFDSTYLHGEDNDIAPAVTQIPQEQLDALLDAMMPAAANQIAGDDGLLARLHLASMLELGHKPPAAEFVKHSSIARRERDGETGPFNLLFLLYRALLASDKEGRVSSAVPASALETLATLAFEHGKFWDPETREYITAGRAVSAAEENLKLQISRRTAPFYSQLKSPRAYRAELDLFSPSRSDDQSVVMFTNKHGIFASAADACQFALLKIYKNLSSRSTGNVHITYSLYTKTLDIVVVGKEAKLPEYFGPDFANVLFQNAHAVYGMRVSVVHSQLIAAINAAINAARASDAAKDGENRAAVVANVLFTSSGGFVDALADAEMLANRSAAAPHAPLRYGDAVFDEKRREAIILTSIMLARVFSDKRKWNLANSGEMCLAFVLVCLDYYLVPHDDIGLVELTSAGLLRALATTRALCANVQNDYVHLALLYNQVIDAWRVWTYSPALHDAVWGDYTYITTTKTVPAPYPPELSSAMHPQPPTWPYPDRPTLSTLRALKLVRSRTHSQWGTIEITRAAYPVLELSLGTAGRPLSPHDTYGSVRGQLMEKGFVPARECYSMNFILAAATRAYVAARFPGEDAMDALTRYEDTEGVDVWVYDPLRPPDTLFTLASTLVTSDFPRESVPQQLRKLIEWNPRAEEESPSTIGTRLEFHAHPAELETLRRILVRCLDDNTLTTTPLPDPEMEAGDEKFFDVLQARARTNLKVGEPHDVPRSRVESAVAFLNGIPPDVRDYPFRTPGTAEFGYAAVFKLLLPEAENSPAYGAGRQTIFATLEPTPRHFNVSFDAALNAAPGQGGLGGAAEAPLRFVTFSRRALRVYLERKPK
jgi:hypothetical protein